jgi:ATP/maltotriose-dependent transcriptional regulator MalT
MNALRALAPPPLRPVPRPSRPQPRTPTPRWSRRHSWHHIIAEALRLVDRTRKTSWRNNDVLIDIAKAQVAVGDLEGARRVAGRIEESGDAWYIVDVLCVVAVAQAHTGDRVGALASLEKSRQAALRLPAKAGPKPGSPRAEALSKTAAAYAQIGDGETSSTVARSIPNQVPGAGAAEVLLTIAKIQAATGDTSGAFARCEEALKLLSHPREAVRYRWTCGDREGAWRAVRETPDTSAAFWSLARAEARAGNLAGALKAVEAIPDDRRRVLALAQLAPLQAKAGDVTGARETASKITDESRRAGAFQAVAWARARSGDLQGAIDEAATEQSPLVRCRMLLGVVEARLGRSTGALALADTTTEQPWDLLPLKPQ